MPELNPSKQHCQPDFFTGDFKFYCLLLGEKAYLIDVSFRFNEIKFCTLLVNWVIRGKMFTYFYNKFRPVKCMHYINCVNSSYSHNSGCYSRCVALWFTVLSRHILFTIGVIYKFTFVWYSAKQGTTHRPTSHLAHLYAVPFLWPQEEHTWQGNWVDDFTD
jgi:hypothetical protein